MSLDEGRYHLVEGYASLFGQEDLSGDVVRAGAFAHSLRAGGRSIPMLYQHRSGYLAGRWTRIEEDSSGLKVRGLVTSATSSGRAALEHMDKEELDGLSIGFVAEVWSSLSGGGRLLKRLQLREVSLVTSPMLPSARFAAFGSQRPAFTGRGKISAFADVPGNHS